VTRAIARSLGIALLTAFIAISGEWVTFRRCPAHRALAAPVILDGGFAVARPGDAQFACTVRHCLVGSLCHDDARCYCAPPEVDVAARIGGACVVDHLHPAPADEDGRCRNARCTEHLDGK